ncbi:helix-turn-helix domain-containing protein [Vibrio tasmaniensis]
MAKYLKVSRTSVNKWVQTFLEEGLEGLKRNLAQAGLHISM